MEVVFPFSVHPFHSEDSQAADQQPPGADVDWFAMFVPKTDQWETPTEEEQMGLNHHPNLLMLLLLIFGFETYLVQFLAFEQKMIDIPAE